jgi:hypothetical protein
MPKIILIAFTLTCLQAFAQDQTLVDLDDARAVAQLQESNPAHFAKIQKILAGLAEQPQRAEGDWLQVNFDATGVHLSRFMIKTSLPPKQHLQFRLDNVQYSMNLTRSDITASFMPAQ